MCHHWHVRVLGRFVIYLIAIAIVTYGAFVIGAATFDCPPNGFECDMAAFNGLIGGAIGFTLAVIGCVLAEIVRSTVPARPPNAELKAP